jgi:glycosyltransferase involved in cell wall biosynthesis
MHIWLTCIGQWLRDAERSRTFLLAEALRQHGHDVTLWTSAWDHLAGTWRTPDAMPDRLHGVRIIYLAGCGYRQHVGVRRYADHWLIARRFLRRARAEPRPDVIVAAIPDHLSAAAAARFAAERQIPVIVDLQDKWPDLIFERARSAWSRRLVRTALAGEIARTATTLRRADSVVAIMPAFRQWAAQTYGRAERDDPIFPLATETAKAPDQPPVPSGSQVRILDPKARLRIAFVGTFNRTQHPASLLDAIDIIAEEGFDGARKPEFVIAGDGAGAEDVARRSAAHANVAYLGWLSPAEIDALLARSDIGVVVTRFPTEIFNHKLFSYLSHGLAIVSTASGDLATLIDSEGIGANVAAGDPRALAEALRRLIASEDRLQAMRRNARRLFAERFDQKLIYGNYAAHVAKVAASGVRGA